VNSFLTLIASAESGGEKNLFQSLGIDWRMMIFQLIAFAILVFVLAKFVYPPILKMLDRREKLIEDSVKAAKDANEKAAKSADEVAKQLANARKDAEDIVAAAREQSAQMLADSEKEAQKRADATVESARQQLARDVESARKMLRDETADLVALATEKVVNEKINSAKDSALIRDAIAKSQRGAQ
jgi:F-type H+-transporting ATPase subunit b